MRKNFGGNPKIQRARLYYGWPTLAALLVIGIISFGIRFSFGVFFRSLQEDFGWTRTQTSGVFSVYMGLAGVFGILGGWAVDRYGPKAVAAVMGFFTGLSLLLTSQANAPWHVLVTYSLLLAIGTGPTYTVIMSTTSRWFVKRRGLALGVASSGGDIGIMVMTLISAWLIASYGWHNSYLIMAFTAFFTMIPCALLLKRAPSEIVGSPDFQKLDATQLSAHDSHSSSEPGKFSLLQAAKTKNFWLIVAQNYLWALCIFTVMTHIVPHAIDLGIVSTEAASILSLIGGMSILGRLIMGRVSDSVGRIRALVITALLMAGAISWLIGSSSLWMLYIFAIIFGFSYGGSSASIAALVGDIFGLRHIGVIIAVGLGISWSAGAVSGPVLAGYIFDISGSYVPAFLAVVMATLIIAVLITLLRTQTAKKRDKAIG